MYMYVYQVIWGRLYSTKTVCDKGTLYQLKHLIHRTSVPSDPAENMKAADFMELVLEAHVIAAANELMDSVNGGVMELANGIVKRFVRILPDEVPKPSDDNAYDYACEILSLGLVWYNYLDAVREGDGHCVMSIWKLLLVIFKKTGRRNYAKEAALLLINYHFLLSDRKAAQVRNERFINTQGGLGRNIASDLYMEHLNRRLKAVIRHLGSNIQPPTLCRAARAIGVVDNICSVFERETTGKRKGKSGRHSKPSSLKDHACILEQLLECQVYSQHHQRKHHGILLKTCLMDSCDTEMIYEWMVNNIISDVLY